MKSRTGGFLVVLGMLLILLALLTSRALSNSDAWVWIDDFDAVTLKDQWTWLYENTDYWTLSANPGFLRITTQEDNVLSKILLQNEPAGDYSLETHLWFTPTQNFQIAAIAIWLDSANNLALGRAYCEEGLGDCIGDGIYFDYVVENVNTHFLLPMGTQEDVFLRVTRDENSYSGYMSLNGTDWTLLGTHVVNFAPTSIGLKASNQTLGVNEINADFDYVILIDDSERIFIPLLVK